MKTEFFETLQSLVAWLSAPDGGAFIVISMAISYLAEKLAWWHKIKYGWKVAIMFGLALAIRLGAVLLLANPELMAMIEPYYDFFVASLLGWNILEIIHKTDSQA